MSDIFQPLLEAVKESTKSEIYTAIPCIVVASDRDASDMIVTIQPTINKRKEDGTVAEYPIIQGVPVCFPVSDNAGMTFPINPGKTTGLAIFSMRSIEAWKSGNGKPAAPMNQAKLDKSDAIFIPGIMPQGNSVNNPAKHVYEHSTKDVAIFNNLGTSNEVEIRLKQDGSVIINAGNKLVEVNCGDATVNAVSSVNVNAPEMTVDVANTLWIGNIQVQGNIVQTGNYTLTGAATFNGIPFDTHKHIGVTPGPGTTGGPTA
jgi:phage baseplate assembly protein gpV